MFKKHQFISVFLILVLVVVNMMIPIQGSTTIEELDRQAQEQQVKQKALEKKLKEQEAQKKANQALLGEIESQFDLVQERLAVGDQNVKDLYSSISDLELEIAKVNMTLDDLEFQLEIKENEIIGTELELQRIKKDKELLYEQAKERMRVMYEYGDTGFLDVMFESSDLMDMFSRLEYINRLVDADNDLFANLDQYEGDILGKETELEVHETILKDLAGEVLEEKTVLDEKVTSKTLEVERVDELIEIQKSEQAVLAKEETATEANIDEINDTIDAIAAENKRVDDEIKRLISMRAAAIARENGYDYNGGMILWPVPGWSRISSKFGPRLHPIHKTWKNHNGIDIPASSGTPIIAVMDGEVILAKYSSSYGNYAIIAHGNGYVSLYGHSSKLLVSKGDKVYAGQPIAKVGTTGWSTGNHLHFGFQKNDVWVNPMDYIGN